MNVDVTFVSNINNFVSEQQRLQAQIKETTVQIELLNQSMVSKTSETTYVSTMTLQLERAKMRVQELNKELSTQYALLKKADSTGGFKLKGDIEETKNSIVEARAAVTVLQGKIKEYYAICRQQETAKGQLEHKLEREKIVALNEIKRLQKVAAEEQIAWDKKENAVWMANYRERQRQNKQDQIDAKKTMQDSLKAQETTSGGGGMIASWGKYLLRYYVAFQGIQIAMQGISNAYNTLKDFEYAMAGVKAVSGATASEFENLKQKAISLSGTTLFNAVDIAKLEEVYSKAGFTTKQISAMIEPTLKTATATDDSLENTSELLGGIINGFKLNADNTKHIADVMGLAFNKSMLDLSKFKESMKYVGNIAAEAGFSFEEVSAILMVASNNMMSGSMAGTALRQVFNSMLNPTSKFSKAIGGTVYGLEGFMNALKGLKEKGADLGTMFQITDKRAANLFNIMMNNTDQLKLFTEQARNANGEMDKMAAIKMDTLTGQTARFNGEWQKMILVMGKGTGFFKELMSGLATAIDVATAGSLRYNESLVLINNQQVKQRKHISDSLEAYESLAKKVGKTVEENNKLSIAISTLQLYFDDNIIKINKETGEYDINTAAIENNLKARNKLLFGVGGEKDKIISDYTNITRARTQTYVDLEENYAKLKKTYSLLSKDEKEIVNKPPSKISDRGTPTVTVGRFKTPESSTKYSDVLQGYIDDYKLQNNLISKWDKLVLDASAKQKEFTESGFGQVRELIKESKQLTSQIQAEIKTPEQIASEAKADADALKNKSKELTDDQKKELLAQLKDKKEIDANKIQSEYETDVKLLNQNQELIDAKNKLESEDYETQLVKTKERITQLVNSSKGITKTLLAASFNEKLKLIEDQRKQDTDAYNFDIALAIKLKKEKDALAISNYENDVKIAKWGIKDSETLSTKLTLLESTKNKEILENQKEYTKKAKSLRESLHGKDYKFNTVIDQKQLESDLSGAYSTYDEYFNTLFPSDQVLIKQFEKWRSENLSDEQIKELAKDWEQEISKSLGENVDITGMWDSFSLLHKKTEQIDYDKLFNLSFPSKQDMESAFKQWIKEGKTEGEIQSLLKQWEEALFKNTGQVIDLGKYFKDFDKRSYLGKVLGMDEQGDRELTNIMNDLSSKFKSFVDNWVSGYEKISEAKNQQVSEAQAALDTELKYSEDGYASNVDLKRKELAAVKSARDKALREQRDAYKIQMGLEAALQISETITAIVTLMSKEISSKGLLGILTGGAGIISLFAILETYKTKAASTFERGGVVVLKGKSHAEGGISFGDGLEAQGGESGAIFTKDATNKNLPLIRKMVYAINNDKIVINKDVAAKMGDTHINFDTTDIKAIRTLLERKIVNSSTEYGDGFRIERFGSHTKKIFYN